MEENYLKEFENCKLCEWRCGVNRPEGELGVCRMSIPKVASCQLHPAPPESYTIFLTGCNFRCLNCQNHHIAHLPDQLYFPSGFIRPEILARESLDMINSIPGRSIGADRIFFSGGEPTIHLPYVEKIVNLAREMDPKTKVNFDTNGFLTKKSLNRVIEFTTSITFDIKAYNDEVHRSVTGAPVKPVLRNAKLVGERAKEKLWEYRILVIPEIVDLEEVRALCEFIASIDSSLPVSFLAFRPNFVLDKHYGAPQSLMDAIMMEAENIGLENFHWSGRTNIGGYDTSTILSKKIKLRNEYTSDSARTAGAFALSVGCSTHPRNCKICSSKHVCPIKGYQSIRYV